MRTKKIYYLATSSNTYMRRHDLYNSGARWDAKTRRWWAATLTPVKKAAEMVGGDSKIMTVHVQQLPKQGLTHRGGRPRAPRKNRNGNGTTEVAASDEPQPLAALDAGFVRGARSEDRRKQSDRRNEATRPEAVLVVPMAHAPELQEA